MFRALVVEPESWHLTAYISTTAAAHVGHTAIQPVARSIDLDWSDDAGHRMPSGRRDERKGTAKADSPAFIHR
jgi:hypothetical protein